MRKRLTGTSAAIAKIRRLAPEYALEEEPVLLTGETGVGKSHIAELIHLHSGRKGDFVVVDIPTISENLFESELFGHKKGAFTGAWTNKTGLIEKSAGGTLFIDEISEMSLSLQAKLLRFIDTKTYRILGDASQRRIEVRVIAATNKDLHQAITKGEFRQDLYFRLQVLEIHIPPLRERKNDIIDLVRENQLFLKGKSMGKGSWDALLNHHWPGNIRELFSVLKRAAISCEDPITGDDIRAIIENSCVKEPINTKSNLSDKMNRIWERIIGGKTFWEAVKKPYLARDLNRSEVKEIISRGMVRANGKYKKLIKVFNLKDEDYHKFMTFLRDNRLR